MNTFFVEKVGRRGVASVLEQALIGLVEWQHAILEGFQFPHLLFSLVNIPLGPVIHEQPNPCESDAESLYVMYSLIEPDNGETDDGDTLD
jgi:hypothetical protein